MNASSTDQLSFTLFIALILHSIVGVGLGFVYRDNISFTPARDVTLVLDSSPNDDPDADFLAQASSQASGELEKAEQLSTEFESDFLANESLEVRQQGGQPQMGWQELLVVMSYQGDSSPDQDQPNPVAEQMAADDRTSQELASLSALLAERTQAYARQPRIKTISSVSATRADEAEYLFNWQQRVERVGNANYPQAAVRQQLTGDVRMLVGINRSGGIEYIQMRASSGHSLLDAAAEQTLRLSAPFAPLPSSIDTDILEIIRTFRFRTDLVIGGNG